MAWEYRSPNKNILCEKLHIAQHLVDLIDDQLLEAENSHDMLVNIKINIDNLIKSDF